MTIDDILFMESTIRLAKQYSGINFKALAKEHKEILRLETSEQDIEAILMYLAAR
jgi:hypothetical protein